MYSPLLGYFFARDDFGFLAATTLIPPRNWFFRPLSQQFYFWSNTQIWGLNPLGFRLIGIFMLTINTLLIYKLIKRFCSRVITPITLIPLAGSVFYAFNTIHLFEIGWISAHYQALSTLLFLLTVLLATSERRVHKSLSFVTLILAFLSGEMSIFIAPIILVYYLCTGGIYDAKNKKASPYFLLTFLYLMFYLLYVKLPGGNVYGRSFDVLTILKTLGKYILYPFVAGFDRNSTFSLVNLLFITRISLITLIGGYSLIASNFNKRFALFGIAWFLITVSIFTLLGNHTFAYLDAIPAIGLTMLIAAIWQSLEKKPKLFAISLIALITLSIFSLILSQKTDPDLKWLNDHQQASRSYLENFKLPESKLVILNKNDTNLMEATYFGKLLETFFKKENLTITLTNTK